MRRRAFLLTPLTPAHAETDDRYMERAIALTAAIPRAPFAALLVDPAKGIVAEGRNRYDENPTFHGEIDVINVYARKRGRDWAKLTLYTTAEPCPMCQSAVIWTGIPRVVYGTSVPFLKSIGWEQIDIRAEEVAARSFRKCAIVGGVLEAQCNELFRRAVSLRPVLR